MKTLLAIIFCTVSALQLSAQTNPAPVRLAIINESPETAAAADLLTAEFSKNDRIQMAERAEIDKVYHEQGLSAENTDYIKLGRILGADGLLLMATNYVGTNQFLNIRLVAVKPGVVLADDTFSWPIYHLTEWSPALAAHLDLLLPKLAVAATDAVPISVVNLRSAVSSADGVETERELKLLVLQRLTQEPQLFVLERQKMQLLSEEKDLNADESAFWNGAYLLEGVIDQNGYSTDTVTINARLTPAKGGAPVLIEVHGARANPAEVINSLTAKVNEALKVNSTVKAWNAGDEAAQYFDEAKWALKWGVLPEAQMAADSAWALGKRDMDCAIVRIRAYLVKPDTGGYQQGSFTNPRNLQDVVQSVTEEAAPDRVWGLVLSEKNWGVIKEVDYVTVGKFPDPGSITPATRALELYHEFTGTLPPGEPQAGSSWYRLGLDDLTVASLVLQHFNLVPESQPPVADKLAGLRVLARSVADDVSKPPSVHDSYFVGDRIAVYDELYHFEEESSIFSVKLEYGCLWQETPEDDVALYRGLMASPVFCYIHDQFWLRKLSSPRLVAWNKADQNRIPNVWKNFVQELDGSTNVLWELEAKALRLADATNDMDTARSFTNLFDAIFENRDTLIANNVDLFYLQWHLGALIEAIGDGLASDLKDSLQHLYYGEYSPKLDAMDQEYRTKTAAAGQFALTFTKQKQFLTENKPYDFFEFVKMFQEDNYSPAQAREIQPLVAAYKSNLLAQSQSAQGMQKGQLMGAIGQVGFLENDLRRILNPPAPRPQTAVQSPPPRPAPAPTAAAPVAVVVPKTEVVTNVVTVDEFCPMPLDSLVHLDDSEHLDPQYTRITTTAHHWYEGKLLLDIQYDLVIDQVGPDRLTSLLSTKGHAIAIFDPVKKSWEVIDNPEPEIQVQNGFYHRSVLLHGELFTCDGGQIKKYDFQNRQWQTLPVSDGSNYELFPVNGHLYAASKNMILEITDDRRGMHLLASNRRQPPASILDTQDLGSPVLFEGLDHSLRVCTSGKILTWTGNDWREDSSVPPGSSPTAVFMDGILFRKAGFMSARYQNNLQFREQDGSYGILGSQDEISCLPAGNLVAKLWLSSKKPAIPSSNSMPGTHGDQSSRPIWKMPDNVLPNAPVAISLSKLYLFEDSFNAHASINERRQIFQESGTATESYNAALFCFSPDSPLPQKIFLNFGNLDAGMPKWIVPAVDYLILGSEREFDYAWRFRNDGGGSKPGVWLLPLTSIESHIAEQKQAQVEEQQGANVKAAQARKDLSAKFDLNHNGIIDPDEKELALDDPAFIASELDVIDANHNGWLDADELAYFDPNQHKILDPKAQAGINLAIQLLAQALLDQFGQPGNGWLDQRDYEHMIDASLQIKPNADFALQFMNADVNHDNHIDLAELENLMQQHLEMELKPGTMHGMFFPGPLGMPGRRPPGFSQDLKTDVEAYWRHTSETNRPSLNHPPFTGTPP